MPSILHDDRFQVMFENPDFQVDERSEEFRLINPLISKMGEKRKKKLKMLEEQEVLGQVSLECLRTACCSWIATCKEDARLYPWGHDPLKGRAWCRCSEDPTVASVLLLPARSRCSENG